MFHQGLAWELAKMLVDDRTREARARSRRRRRTTSLSTIDQHDTGPGGRRAALAAIAVSRLRPRARPRFEEIGRASASVDPCDHWRAWRVVEPRYARRRAA